MSIHRSSRNIPLFHTQASFIDLLHTLFHINRRRNSLRVPRQGKSDPAYNNPSEPGTSLSQHLSQSIPPMNPQHFRYAPFPLAFVESSGWIKILNVLNALECDSLFFSDGVGFAVGFASIGCDERSESDVAWVLDDASTAA